MRLVPKVEGRTHRFRVVVPRAAADGVVRFLEAQGIGFDAGAARVPIVPAAVLFDLAVGDPTARPGPDAGEAACHDAGTDVPEGNVGAGTGASIGVGRLKGLRSFDASPQAPLPDAASGRGSRG